MTELAMYKEIVKICDRHGLTYFLSAGTFLGAVRHEGFIPWDDDMDMRMPRPDYEKLIRYLKKELPEPYIIRSHVFEKDVHRYFARVENTRVKFRRTHTKNEQLTNAWIDIFPLDGMPENKLHAKLRKIHLLYRKMLMQISVFDEIVDVSKKRPLSEKIIVFLATHTPIQRMLSFDKCWKKLDRALKAYPLSKSKYYMNFMSAYKYKDIIPKDLYGDGAMYKFEDTKFRGPANYDGFLKILYGDYMKLPPAEARNKHNMAMASLEIIE